MNSKKLSGVKLFLKPCKLTLVLFIILLIVLGFLLPIYPTQTFKTTMVSHTIEEDTIEFNNYTSFSTIWEVFHYDFYWILSYYEPPPMMFPQIDLALTTIIWENSAEPVYLLAIIPLFIFLVYFLSASLTKLYADSIAIQADKKKES